MKKFKMPGYSRYCFNNVGECFNEATGNILATEKMQYGEKLEYYRPINDEGKRVVLYVRDIVAYYKEQRKKDKKPKAELPKGFAHAEKEKKPYPEKRQDIDAGEAIRKAKKDGVKTSVLAAKYGLSNSQINKIAAGVHLAKK